MYETAYPTEPPKTLILHLSQPFPMSVIALDTYPAPPKLALVCAYKSNDAPKLPFPISLITNFVYSAAFT